MLFLNLSALFPLAFPMVLFGLLESVVRALPPKGAPRTATAALAAQAEAVAAAATGEEFTNR
jgi:hypothetical protein